MSSRPSVLSFYGVSPQKIGGMEMFAHELACQLAHVGWSSVHCFPDEPSPGVRALLDVPHASVETAPQVFASRVRGLHAFDRLVKRYRPRIVHFQLVDVMNLCPWAARLRGVESVFFTDHNSRQEGYVIQPAPLYKRLLGRLASLPTTRVMCVTDYVHRCASTRGMIDPARCTRLYSSVDGERAAAASAGAGFRQRWGISQDALVVIQVSSIIPEKGLPDLIAAARTVVSQMPSVHFVLVGEGDQQPEYERLVGDLGIADHFTFTGLCADPFTEGAFAAADIVCQVSRFEEAFGWSIVEGMAHGKPLVATRAGGIPELVLDGETGFLVNRRDPAALASRIIELGLGSGLRARMGNAGRHRALSVFSLQSQVRTVLGLYGISPLPQRSVGEVSATAVAPG